jgi:uncharacterized membrane protein YidH (DUF202 family)
VFNQKQSRMVTVKLLLLPADRSERERSHKLPRLALHPRNAPAQAWFILSGALMSDRRKRGALRRQLAYEFHEYVADLRDLFASLRSVEGLVALILVLTVLGLAVGWFFLGLGFDRLLSVATALGVSRPRVCREVNDAQGVFLVIGGVLFVMLAALAIGEMMRLIDRVRRGAPGRPSAVLFPTVGMAVVGVAGMAMMRYWC